MTAADMAFDAVDRPLVGARDAAAISDEDLFTAYEWCLNPSQTFAALCAHARDELAAAESRSADWQRSEARINFYLLLCAACCTADDYLASRACDVEPAIRRLPRFRAPLQAAAASINAVLAPSRRDRRSVSHYRDRLARCLDCICAILIDENAPNPEAWRWLRETLGAPLPSDLPAELLAWHSRIPEAFRCQDMAHHDVVALAERAVASQFHNAATLFVIGLRTAGAYFAPLATAVFRARGVAVLGWMTIRPKSGLSAAERTQILQAAGDGAEIVVIDDHPNTGQTFRRVLALFADLGVSADRVVLLAPEHPAQCDWAARLHGCRLVTLPFEHLHSQRLLADEAAICRILADCYARQGWQGVRLRPCAEVARVNTALASRLGENFEVRSKRVYGVELCGADGSVTRRNVIAKHVGWGWLGYHAALASLRLPEFVPPYVGLRQGLLFSEWIGPLEVPSSLPSATAVAAIIPAYIAARAARLTFDDDPGYADLGVRRAGWDMLARLLRAPYGRLLGPLLAGSAFRAEFAACRPPAAVLVDGALELAEWVSDARNIAKVDFEHHNFGGAQQDIADPCYDLAVAIRDLDLSADAEAAMVEAYIGVSGDRGASARLPLFKLLAGIAAMRAAAYCAVRAPAPGARDAWNLRYNRARDFLNCQMARHAIRSFGYPQAPPRWSPRLFFLDLDGVFDAELFGPLFQHTTPSGLAALSLLLAADQAVVLNTGRSLGEVRQYCLTYSLAGGIAEYGSVFFDGVAEKEAPLIDDQARQQLADCREWLATLPGVFLDPGYRWSLRAYRFCGELTVALEADECAEIARRFDALGCIARAADTPVVAKNVDKGSGVRFVRSQISPRASCVAAIGDSAQDLAMFAECDIAYIPANFAPEHVRALRGRKYRKLRKPRQLGLLEAARDLTGAAAPARVSADGGDLIARLLEVAEQPRHRRLATLLAKQVAIRNDACV